MSQNFQMSQGLSGLSQPGLSGLSQADLSQVTSSILYSEQFYNHSYFFIFILNMVSESHIYSQTELIREKYNGLLKKKLVNPTTVELA